MKKKIKTYDLGLIPIIVRTKKDADRAGELVQKMAIDAMIKDIK